MHHNQVEFIFRCKDCSTYANQSMWYITLLLLLLSHFSPLWLFATLWTIALQVPLSVGFFRQEYWSGLPCPPPGDLPNPGIEPRSFKLQVDCLPAEPQGKPKNTRVGSLSLLQQIFLTQDSNQGLLHYRQILYQLSYQGSPKGVEGMWNFWIEILSISEDY